MWFRIFGAGGGNLCVRDGRICDFRHLPDIAHQLNISVSWPVN